VDTVVLPPASQGLSTSWLLVVSEILLGRSVVFVVVAGYGWFWGVGVVVGEGGEVSSLVKAFR